MIMKTITPGLVFLALLTGCVPPHAAIAGTSTAEVAKWCGAMPGATREQLLALMGKPVTTLDTQLIWEAPPLRFLAFLDASGSAKQLEISTHDLSDSQIAALPCRPVRSRRAMMLEAAAAAKKPHTSTPACQLVSSAEMSTILGTPVVGKPDDRPGEFTQCTYQPASAGFPSVELKLTWGDGAAAMQGMGMAGKREPGLVTPYDGIGEQAGVAGPLLLIRTGDDLMTMVFNGVTDTPAKAKRIFDAAKARM
jgi:hypothetical protein